jgi:hypothetical protein
MMDQWSPVTMLHKHKHSRSYRLHSFKLNDTAGKRDESPRQIRQRDFVESEDRSDRLAVRCLPLRYLLFRLACPSFASRTRVRRTVLMST